MRHPRSFRRRVAGVACLVVVAGGCGLRGDVLPAEATVYAATVLEDGREVEFAVDVCSRPLLSLTVEETADEVRVTATTERGRDPDDCALATTRRLDEPLGDRVLIDTSTGQPIEQVDRLDR